MSAELYSVFKSNAEAIGASVYRCTDLAATREQISQILNRLGTTTVGIAKSEIVDKLDLENLSKEGFTVNSGNNLVTAELADVGISEVDYAVCETGTLLQNSKDFTKRLVSSLPPVHIALVKEDSLIGKFSDSIALIQASDESSYYTFISGPSRTSDIERVLTIGVHGPEELHIIFISDIQQQ